MYRTWSANYIRYGWRVNDDQEEVIAKFRSSRNSRQFRIAINPRQGIDGGQEVDCGWRWCLGPGTYCLHVRIVPPASPVHSAILATVSRILEKSNLISSECKYSVLYFTSHYSFFRLDSMDVCTERDTNWRLLLSTFYESMTIPNLQMTRRRKEDEYCLSILYREELIGRTPWEGIEEGSISKELDSIEYCILYMMNEWVGGCNWFAITILVTILPRTFTWTFFNKRASSWSLS